MNNKKIKNPKEINELKIFKNNQFCGYLRRAIQSGGSEFVFDLSYTGNLNSKDLSFHLQKRDEPYKQAGINLHPYFAGLLPEGLRLNYLQQKVKTSSDDLFSLFAALGGDCIGDVHTDVVDAINDNHQEHFPKWDSINFYDYFFEVLKKEGQKEVQIFSGVQEKISASMISLPLKMQKNKHSYILKLSPKDKPNLVYNEWLCLTLASLCQIEVNNFELIYDKDDNLGLIVQRFDRKYDYIINQMERIHQEDMCQVLDRYPAEKYRITVREVFEAIEKYSSAPLVDKLKLFQLLVFSYLVGNGDMHGKNISLYENPDDGRISLTPAYDIICTLIYGDTKMALKMDGKDSNFTRMDFVKFGIRHNLTQKSIESVIDQTLNLFYLHHHILYSMDLE